MGSINLDGVLKAVKQVRGGVAVSHNKNTADSEVVRLPIPDRVLLPMQQHIGAPCVPTVKVGDKVGVGQVIGDTDKFVSAPIHASVSGTVSAIKDVKLPNGVISQAVEIESDGEMYLFEGITPPKVTEKRVFCVQSEIRDLSVWAERASPPMSNCVYRRIRTLTH